MIETVTSPETPCGGHYAWDRDLMAITLKPCRAETTAEDRQRDQPKPPRPVQSSEPHQHYLDT